MKHFTPYALLVVFGLASVIMITWLRSENSRLRSDIAGYELLTEGYRQLADLRQASDAAWLDYYTNSRIDAKLRNWHLHSDVARTPAPEDSVLTWPVVEPEATLRDTIFTPFYRH